MQCAYQVAATVSRPQIQLSLKKTSQKLCIKQIENNAVLKIAKQFGCKLHLVLVNIQFHNSDAAMEKETKR